MAISKELREVYASSPTDRRYVNTLSFHHSRFSKDYFFTNDLQPWTFTLETGASQLFIVYPFEIILPNNDRGGNQDLQIGLGYIGRELMDELEAANQLPQEAIRCIYRVYLNSPGDAPQNTPVLELTIAALQAEKLQVNAVARRADILNKPFPAYRYTIDRFPGLDR